MSKLPGAQSVMFIRNYDSLYKLKPGQLFMVTADVAWMHPDRIKTNKIYVWAAVDEYDGGVAYGPIDPDTGERP